MSFIRYEEASVKVGYGAADCQLLATNVTASENLPMTPVRALGYNGAIAVMPSGPPEGSFSITYNISGGSRTGTCGGGSTSYCDQAKFYCAAESDFVMKQGYDPTAAFQLAVAAGGTLFEKGFPTSFSLSAEPNAVITATLQGSFFDCGLQVAGGGLSAAGVLTGHGEASLAHGSKTVAEAASSIGFSCNPFSANYEFTRGSNPIYTLGNVSAAFIQITDPQESITLQGENIPVGTIDTATCGMCSDVVTINFKVGSLCGTDGDMCTYEVCGPVQSRDIEVAVDDVLRGNITVTDYTVPMTLPTLSGCGGD